MRVASRRPSNRSVPLCSLCDSVLIPFPPSAPFPVRCVSPMGAPPAIETVSISPPRADADRWRSAAILAGLAAVGAAIWFLPHGIDPLPRHALAVAVFMIAAWMIHVLDHGVTGILGCFL